MGCFMIKYIMIVISYFLIINLAKNTVFGRNKSPLIDEDGVKTKVKSAECVFDKQVRELGAKWTPDLGHPIGILPCMRCQCIPFQKKRRVVARVQCFNIKNQCPKPSCDEPVVHPGRCCKTCEGDKSPDAVQDILPQHTVELDEKNNKHFVALLTGRSSLVTKNELFKPMENMNRINVVATGRFTVHKRHLYYSFYISENAARPQSLQFLDNQGNILEEFTLSHTGGYVNSVYQNASRKVCGAWRRLARDYRKLLKQEKLYAMLIWGAKDQAEFTLSGVIMKNGALQTEILSALMEPAPGADSALMAGAGGTAILSVSTQVTPSINVAIIFNGLFMPADIDDIPINITLSMDEKRQIVLQETVRVTKPSTDINIVNISAAITQAHLRHLVRGKILLSVSSTSKPDALKLSGNVITKASCEIFQALLSSSSSNTATNSEGSSSGMAWFYFNNAGSLIYNIQVDKLPPKDNPPMITFMDISSKKIRTDLEVLTPFFHGNGWSNGTLDKLATKVLEPLYFGNVAINIGTTSDSSLIKGKVIAKPVDDARDAAAPVLMKREISNLTTNAAVGLAWISVDSDCHLHYDVSLTGVGAERKMELWMEFYPLIAPGAPFINKHLDSFQGNSVEGSPVELLTSAEILRLQNGVSFLKVKDADTKDVLLMATVTKVSIPPSCRLYASDNSITHGDDAPNVPPTGDCYFEERFYKQDETWVSSKNPCQMCFCQDGNPKCYFMTCPETNCIGGKAIMVEGECCKVCVNNSIPLSANEIRKCNLNGRDYLPGTRFNPFLIPYGFDLCTECYCSSIDSTLSCSRLSSDLCCTGSGCNKNKSYNINGPLSDADGISSSDMDAEKAQGSEFSKKRENAIDKILEEGGCKNPTNPRKPYINGTEYHPYIDNLGEYKCVTCKCLSGKPTCNRLHCDMEICKKILAMKRRKEKFNSSDFCCSPKDCKKIIRHKLRKQQSVSSSS